MIVSEQNGLFSNNGMQCSITQLSRFTGLIQQNECTKVQNPRYKDVTLNAYTSASTKTGPY